MVERSCKYSCLNVEPLFVLSYFFRIEIESVGTYIHSCLQYHFCRKVSPVSAKEKNERFGTLRAIFFFFLALACRSGLFTSTRCPGPQKRVARLVYCKAQILKWHRRPIKKGPLGRLVRDTRWQHWCSLTPEVWARPPRAAVRPLRRRLLPPVPSSPTPPWASDWLAGKGANAAAAAVTGSNGHGRRRPHRPMLRVPPPEAEQPAPRLRLLLRPCVLRRKQ